MRHFPEQQSNQLKRFIAQHRNDVDVIEKFFKKSNVEIANFKKEFDATIREDKTAYYSEKQKLTELLLMLLEKLTIGQLNSLKASFDKDSNSLDNNIVIRRLEKYLKPINADLSVYFGNLFEECIRMASRDQREI